MRANAILFALVLLLPACHDDEGNAVEKAKIDREVARQIEIARKDLLTRQSVIRTCCAIGFAILTGGSIAGLIWLHCQRTALNTASRERNRLLSAWPDTPAGQPQRVLDLPANPPTQRPHEAPRRT